MSSSILLSSATGTFYFVEDRDGLKQGYDLSLQNSGPIIDSQLTVKWNGNQHICKITGIAEGESTVRVYIPDVRESVKMTFALSPDSAKGLIIDHEPKKHWKVHCVQFAHHDLGYTDLPSNIFKEFCGFYDDLLRFCDETDHFPEDSKFRYTIEQGWSLLYYLEHRPEETRMEMMRRIKEGRIEVNAFIGNETTELLGPEEMVRMLYPVFELKRKYGIPVVSAEHNDIPGVSWGVAAAMVGAGIKYFAPGLPDYFRWGGDYHTFWDEDTVAPKGVPSVFNWEAPNGEKVLFWYGRQGAGGDVDVCLKGIPGWLERLEAGEYQYDCFRYLTMGGMRDNSCPRVEFAYTCKEWNEKWAYPKLIQSTNGIFFPELEEQLEDIPTYRGELPGTDYSCTANCTAYPSSLNRVTHDQLLAAERIATIASTLGEYKYQKDTLSEAYYCTLLNDEHAWGLAHPTGPAHEGCIAQHVEFAYRAAALTQDIIVKAVNNLADQISRDDDCYYSMVFNPLEHKRTDIVNQQVRPMHACGLILIPLPKSEKWDGPRPYWNSACVGHDMIEMSAEIAKDGIEIIDMTTGKAVPYELYEITSPQAPVPYASYRYASGAFDPRENLDIRFIAEDVPPMGYKVYKIRPAKKRNYIGSVKIGRNTLENRFYKLELDPKSGVITSIFDKELGRELIDKDAVHGGNQLVIRSSQTAEVFTSGKARIEKGRNGALSGSLLIKTEAIGYPQITQEIILYSDIKRIDIANRVLKDSTPMLETYFAFPFAFDKPKFKYEGSLSVIEPAKDQFPGSNTDYYCIQHWADVSDSKSGVTISSIDAPMMQFGANWPLYISQAHHGYTPPNFDHPFHTAEDVKKGHIYSFVLLNNYRTNFSPTQNGDLLFRYSITSHEGDWQQGRAFDFGYDVSVPFVPALTQGKQEASLPMEFNFLSVDKDNVVLLTLKRAEDDDGYIVRLMETQGKDAEVTITIPFLNIIKGYATNLVEENEKIVPTTMKTVTVNIKAWDTATVRVAST